jgi:hypothetical protein
MSDLQLLLAQFVKLGLITLLVGMMLRGRAALCWSFTFYIVAIMIGNGLVTLAPDRFYWGWFFVLKQGVYDLLKMVIAVELAWRAFRSFPGAWRTARLVLIGLLVTSTLALSWLTPRSSYNTLWEWQPSVATAAVWLFTSVALLVVLYQIPIGEWQRAIVLGFAPYQLVFVTLLNVLRRHGWQVRAEIGVLDALAYLAVVLYWTYSAWRRDPAQPVTVPLESFA